MLTVSTNLVMEANDNDDLHKGSESVSGVLKKVLKNIEKVKNAVTPENSAPAAG